MVAPCYHFCAPFVAFTLPYFTCAKKQNILSDFARAPLQLAILELVIACIRSASHISLIFNLLDQD